MAGCTTYGNDRSWSKRNEMAATFPLVPAFEQDERGPGSLPGIRSFGAVLHSGNESRS